MAFAERGAHVWACDVLDDELRETEALCRDRQGVVSCSHRRRARPGRRRRLRRRGVGSSGRVDILVNNAGGVLGQVGRPLEQITPEEWQAIFDVNVTGAFYFSQAVAPGMKAARSGRIVNISSGAGLGHQPHRHPGVRVGQGRADRADAAAGARTRAVGHHGQQHRAGVRAIQPDHREAVGVVRQEGQRALVDRIALKRLGTPEDIAYGVLFFASEYAGWISGQVISIDGGK